MKPRRGPARRECAAGVALVAALAGAIAPARAAAPSAVGADHGMVVSAHALASAVGVQIMRQGGNVVDAAVAVGYTLAVVYPAAGNLGGGGFMTIRFADGRTTFLDFRERAPRAARTTLFQDAAGAVVPGRSTDSWLAVGVPGSVAGLEAARERYGTLPRATLIAPAIALARDGYVLGEGDVTFFRAEEAGLAKDAAARAIFLPDGHAPQPGTRLTQPDLARTLDTIARDGAAAVYGGPLGNAIADASAAGGGIITRDDFAAYRVRELPTLTCTYRGYTLHAAPPPSSGGTTLCEILNIAEGYDLARLGFHGAGEVHVMAEAMRHAYHDRNDTLGDPAFVDNPVAHLTDKAYAATIRATIAPATAGPAIADPPSATERAQTTHYSIADAHGNAVAVTTTLNGWFGAHRVAGDTGIVMNNEMDDFTAKPGSPNMFGLVQGTANAIAPGKTPLSSMSPTIVDKDGRLVMVIGSPGGSRIISTVAETLVNVIDHGMSLADAIDAPRFHMQDKPDVIALEPFALSPDTTALLVHDGYALKSSPEWGMAAGILAGAPSVAPNRDNTAGQPLSLEGAGVPSALYGVEDARSPTGDAEGF